jgi:hypothetical protein
VRVTRRQARARLRSLARRGTKAIVLGEAEVCTLVVELLRSRRI